MGAEEPFLYDPVRDDFTRPYTNFDPKAVSRASLTPKTPKPKQEGPLVSFNQHPDSWFIPASADSGTKPMKPNVKKWIKGTRIAQLILRCFELICSAGLLTLMIMMKNVYFSTLWIMRIVPGVAILHTLYGVYHLSRKASGRTPGSSASYMFFASFFDLSFVPFYAFSAYWSNFEDWGWATVFSKPHITDIFTIAVFYCAAVGCGLFLISFGLSAYLALVFRKITNLPPDMNPLEDNLTSRASRHKRNKSSMSTVTTISEKRISAPLESNRSFATLQNDFAAPPMIPFLQTRTGSTESFSTYKTTPPPSRDSRLDLPSRQYQIKINSARSSMVDLKRGSYGASSPPKRASYTEIPISETGSEDVPRQLGMIEEAWFTAKSLNSKQSRASSPEKGTYQPIEQPYGSENWTLGHPNPLEANPPTPRHNVFLNRDSPLSEISNNRASGDIADMTSQAQEIPSIRDFKAKHYGELRACTPPVLVGANRQVSSGADYPNLGGFRSKNRDVSGKIVEEGRGGEKSGWGTRFRKISGLK